MDVKLVTVGGKNAGREVPVAGPEFLIGRGEQCQLRPASDKVSRCHCAIVLKDGYVGVRDFKSTNGTFVNGARVDGEKELKNGDHLSVGSLEFEVQLAVEVGGKKKPKVHSIKEAAARTVQSSAAQDVDIFNLLGEELEVPDDAPSQPQNSSDTMAPGADDETQLMTAEDTSGQPKKENTAGIFGKQKQEKAPLAGSSRDAAAEVLNRMLQNRK